MAKQQVKSGDNVTRWIVIAMVTLVVVTGVVFSMMNQNNKNYENKCNKHRLTVTNSNYITLCIQHLLTSLLRLNSNASIVLKFIQLGDGIECGYSVDYFGFNDKGVLYDWIEKQLIYTNTIPEVIFKAFYYNPYNIVIASNLGFVFYVKDGINWNQKDEQKHPVTLQTFQNNHPIIGMR